MDPASRRRMWFLIRHNIEGIILFFQLAIYESKKSHFSLFLN